MATNYKISGLSQIANANMVPGVKTAVVDPNDTTTAPAGPAGSDKWATIGQLLGVANYYFPTGDGSGVDDPGNINTILAAGDPVVLLPAAAGNNYYVKNKISLISGSFLGSEQAWASSNNDNYGAGIGGPGGAVLWMVNAFADAYAIDLYNTTGTQAYGADIAGLLIYGEALPSPTSNSSGGIRIHGAWGAGHIRHVAVVGVNGDCLHGEVDNTTGKVPDEWRMEWLKLSGSYGGNGLIADNMPDSVLDNIQCSNNALSGWKLGWSTNTKIINPKSEQNGQYGYWWTGTGGSGDVLWIANPTTHINAWDGMYFDNTTPGEGGAGTYQISDGGFIGDGTAGGTTYGAIRSHGCLDRIIVSDTTAQGAYYGARLESGSYGMQLNGGWYSGTGTPTSDDGSNTHALVTANLVSF